MHTPAAPHLDCLACNTGMVQFGCQRGILCVNVSSTHQRPIALQIHINHPVSKQLAQESLSSREHITSLHRKSTTPSNSTQILYRTEGLSTKLMEAFTSLNKKC
eukprot:scaffold269025_cov21-Tisochrysis_lutea.AAC.2